MVFKLRFIGEKETTFHTDFLTDLFYQINFIVTAFLYRFYYTDFLIGEEIGNVEKKARKK